MHKWTRSANDILLPFSAHLLAFVLAHRFRCAALDASNKWTLAQSEMLTMDSRLAKCSLESLVSHAIQP